MMTLTLAATAEAVKQPPTAPPHRPDANFLTLKQPVEAGDLT
jgi:hypothetical protein